MAETRAARGSMVIPELRATSITGREGIDAAVAAVTASARAWAATGPAERALLLDRMIDDTLAAADGWVADAATAKGLSGNPAGEAEEWQAIWLVVRNLRLLRDALADIAALGRPRLPGQLEQGPRGRLRVMVYPQSVWERAMFPGVRAWVWLQPHVSLQDFEERQAWAYRPNAARAPVAAVLAAGNYAALAPRDVLYKVFVEGRVAVLKANPVNDYLIPHWARALAALIEHSALRIVTGGSADGAYLVGHPQVDEVHLTGSDKTFEALVFGAGPEGARRKATGTPVLNKPVTGELGSVSPVIVVPGRWRPDELRYQARHIATMLVSNAGFNCITSRVLITSASWPQRRDLLDELARVLQQMPERRAYYPGAAERHATFLSAHPEARLLGTTGPAMSLPWTVVPDIDPAEVDDICFTTEAFCSLVAETALPAVDPVTFISHAAQFANDTLWGTLAATVLIDPRTSRQPAIARALARAVADLRYGTVAVNIWHSASIALASPTWGGYPGQPVTDIQSGRGVTGNTLMLPDPEKTVIRAPFRTWPAPIWLATHRGTLPACRTLPSFEAHPTIGKLARMTRFALGS
jgi:acyl-CoA reductase-like NAD-dependent aldehyde dehydrogenase